MTRVTVTLLDEEREALRTLAERERRDPRAQAALLIRLALEGAGLLRAFDSEPARHDQAKGELCKSPT